jgi:Peptidase family M23
MKKTLLFQLLCLLATSNAFASAENPQCTPACDVHQVCMNNFSSFGTVASATCAATPTEAPIDFVLPADSKTELVCVHSSGSGSHSSVNAYFALDLSTEYSGPAATVRAAADGTAFVFGSNPTACSSDSSQACPLCTEPPGTAAQAQSSSCGNSWGNHILILHENGYASFYVHLDHPLVTTGTFVHAGDPIGVEGWTGAAGSRQIHWSVQQIPGTTTADWTNHISQGWVGASVPFHFLARQNGSVQKFEVMAVHCAHADIGQAPASQQPRFEGR